MSLLNCQICDKPAVNFWRCDEHYICDRCGKTPPEKTFWADRGCWCATCWEARVNDLIAENQRKPKETRTQALAVCPWCGKAENDSWELEEGENTCGRCNREYILEIIVTRDYTTRKVEPT